jgi:hypothetical protein
VKGEPISPEAYARIAQAAFEKALTMSPEQIMEEFMRLSILIAVERAMEKKAK